MDYPVKIKPKFHQSNMNNCLVTSGLYERTKKNSLNLKKKEALTVRNTIIYLWILQMN